jgi:hypothetical protein
MFAEEFHLNESICSYISIVSPIRVFGLRCFEFERQIRWTLCQKPDQSFNKTSPMLLPLNISFPAYDHQNSFSACSSQYTHNFLSCEFNIACKVFEYMMEYPIPNQNTTNKEGTPWSVKMFKCEKYGETVHYTLMCDFRRDCTDGSDETRCQKRERARIQV